MKRHGRPHFFVTDKLCSLRAAMKVIGKKPGAGLITGRRTHTRHLGEESGQCFDLGGCELYRNLAPSTLLFTTISTNVRACLLSDQK